MKVPRKKGGYANGGAVDGNKPAETASNQPAKNPPPKPNAAVQTFSWEDYNQKLGAWQPTSAVIPNDIAQYQSQWIVPTIKNYQGTLNQALAAKYNLQAGQAPGENQFLTPQEAAQALGGQDKYSDYLQFVSGYQQYRQKTASFYNAPSVTAGTFDPTGEAYGMRHYNLFSTTPQQQQANAQLQQAALRAAAQRQKQQQTAGASATGMKDGGKVGKYGMADGGFTLTPEQQAYLDTLGTDEAKNQFLSTIMPEPVNKGADASGVFSALKGQLPFAMIGATAGNVLDKTVQLDPNNQKRGFFNENQEEVKGAGVGALKGAGTGAGIGANPALMAATGGLSLPIGAAAGALIGGGVGWVKGKKQGKAQDDVRNLSAQRSAMANTYGMKDGGKVVGPGTGRSDDVPAEIRQGSFIVPAKNAKLAQKIRKQFLGDGGAVANTDQTAVDTVPVYLSNGEHMFTPEEADMLVNTHGINLDALAPDSDKKMGYGYQNGGYVSAHKAKKILKDGTVRGNKLTEKQMNYFGWIAGGRKGGYKDGGEVGGGDDALNKKIAAETEKANQQLQAEIKRRDELRAQLDKKDQSGRPTVMPQQRTYLLAEADKKVAAAQRNVEYASNPANYKPGPNNTIVYDPAGGGAAGASMEELMRTTPTSAPSGSKMDQLKAQAAKEKADKAKMQTAKNNKNAQEELEKERRSRVFDATRQLSEAQANLKKVEAQIEETRVEPGRGAVPRYSAERKLELLTQAQQRVDNARKQYDAAKNPASYQQAADGTVVFNPGGAPAKQQPAAAKTQPTVTPAASAQQKPVGAVGATGAAAPPASAPRPAGGVFSGMGGAGGGSKAEQATSAELKAIQDRFIAAHGGIGSQDQPTASEPTKTATETPAIDAMKKQWRELTDAGKVGEAQALEEQMKQMGYRYQYNPATKSSDWVSVAGQSIGAQGVFQQMGDLTTAAETPEEAAAIANNLPGANIKKVYDAIGGAGGLLGLGQVAVGMIQSAKEKRPIDTVDPMLLQRQQQAIAEAQYGFEPQALSSARQDIATQRSNVFGMIRESGAGNVGATSANARMAAMDANKAALDLSAADARMREAKQGRADMLTQNVAESRRRVFQDSFGAFQQNQAATAQLIGAGLSNIFGAIQAGQNQKAADERAAKYGNVFMGLPTTP